MKLPVIRLLWLLSAAAASAATHAVLPGEAIQPKIDAAAPGDIIAIFGGTYPGDVTINKAVRLVEVDGQEVTITGNVTWNNVTNAPPFEGFTVGSSGKGITVNSTTGLMIKNVDARPSTGLFINGTSLIGVIGGFYSQIQQNAGELVTNDIAITGDFTSTISAQKTVALRNRIAGNVSWNSRKAWFGYSTSRRFTFGGSESQVFLVGSTIDVLGGSGTVVSLGGTGNKYSFLNSSIIGSTHGNLSSFWTTTPGNQQIWTYIYYYSEGVVMSGAGNDLRFINCYVNLNNAGYNYGLDTGRALRVSQGRATVYNCILRGAQYGVDAPYGSDVQNCFFASCTNHVGGGVLNLNSLSGDPIFLPNEAPKLQAASPCINAGLLDPIYNDLDGTRNDIGPSGGCFFDPDGWTTNKPVVISFDLAPQQLLKGVDTQVTISNGQAVAQP